MLKLTSLILVLFAFSHVVDCSSMPMRMMFLKVGDRLEIEYYDPKKLERFVKNAKGVDQHQVYRICNGNNKAKCGFWENIKTKKKVGPATNSNKKKKMMVIPKVKLLDAGTYRDNNYDTVDVYIEQ